MQTPLGGTNCILIYPASIKPIGSYSELPLVVATGSCCDCVGGGSLMVGPTVITNNTTVDSW